MKAILLLYLTHLTVFGQPQKEVLAQGVSFKWTIERMNDNGQSQTYFYFKPPISRYCNGLDLEIISKEELSDFVNYLNLFSTYKELNEYDVVLGSFSLKKHIGNAQIEIVDYRGLYLRLSKTNCHILAGEISKNLTLMQ